MGDFPHAEYQARVVALQGLMVRNDIDAVLLTTEAEFNYFSGFRTQFWQSPARPWFLIIRADEGPIAIIPAIGRELMAQNAVTDIRTWNAPNPADEGVSLLLEALQGLGCVGIPMGEESSLRMPLADFARLKRELNVLFVDATPLIKRLRMVKSKAEIALIGKICALASKAFGRAPELFFESQPLSAAFREFKIALLKAGAEDVAYLVGGAGQGGYGDVISPPSDAPLQLGDILMLDTGATLNGYFCDFDRNFAIGAADSAARAAYRALWESTEAGLAAARAGADCATVFGAMATSLPAAGASVGRMGHGLGLQLTEYPSFSATDHTVLEPGMVMTLEPSMQIATGRMMVHEENILITDGAPILLTERAAPELPVI